MCYVNLNVFCLWCCVLWCCGNIVVVALGGIQKNLPKTKMATLSPDYSEIYF